MNVDALGVLRTTPRPARVLVVTDELLLLRIDRDHGPPGRKRLTHLFVDEAELRVAVRVLLALHGLPRALQAVFHRPEQLPDRGMTHRMAALRQLTSKQARASCLSSAAATRDLLDSVARRACQAHPQAPGRSPRSADALPPARRTRPGGRGGSSSSRSPFVIVGRESPHTPLTRVTPPCPIARASPAANSRRARSSRCGHSRATFSRNTFSSCSRMPVNIAYGRPTRKGYSFPVPKLTVKKILELPAGIDIHHGQIQRLRLAENTRYPVGRTHMRGDHL